LRPSPACLALLLTGLALSPTAGAAEGAPAGAAAATGPGPAAAGYQFAAGKTTLYTYDLSQQVEWQSAGDTLSYTSSVGWEFSLTPQQLASERCELAVVILHIAASHAGPAGSHLVDSRLPVDRNGRDDPLLGHLLALDGAQLTVVLDPRTGAVEAVRGGEEIVKRINQRFPAASEGEVPPLDAQSRAAYGSAALARLWGEMLALPAGDGVVQTVPLNGPLAGSIERSWQGARYTLSLPKGTEHLDGALFSDPTPVTASVSAVSGGGETVLRGGLPSTSSGELRFVVTLSALTQPVVQRHHLSWTLRQGR
jgi:hypothetical protein